jgi:cytochrome c peroxidase
MKSLRAALIAALLLFLLLFCGRAEPEQATDYQWNLPKGFPKPYVPADNPMTAEKVELGRYLFYDTRMSVNGKASCATCHKQQLAFTDGLAVSSGATGEPHPRGAMSLVNVAYNAALTWSNPQMKSLEKQALTPMFGDHPVELGLREGDQFLPMLRADPNYRALFERAFPTDADRFTIANVTRAVASFERSIVSARSPYDRYHYDRDDTAISDSAKRGEILFFNQRLSCFRCHGGFNFSDATFSERNPEREVAFHNTGVDQTDPGKFKAPTLRNIALTAPYMHDGRIPTLDGVLDHYAAGGRGHDNPNKDPLIGGFVLSPQDRGDLIEFLKSLTDDAVLHDLRFADPRASSARRSSD